MSKVFTLGKDVTASPIVAVTIYIAVLIALLLAFAMSISGLLDQRRDVAASAAMLEQLEGRRPAGSRAEGDTATPSGSAYLEGATVTVAGATLLQRVAGSVMKFGGNVLSTQLDVPSTPAKAGFISMIASCEIEQPQLQKVLYDLEAGMPFLFIDQLAVQTVQSGSDSREGRLRVLLSVSGQWRGTK